MGLSPSSLAGSKRPLSDSEVPPIRKNDAPKRPRINEVRNRQLHADLVKQLEFYISVANLRRDRFLVNQMWADPGGWVKVETIMTFNRVKQMGATESDVLAALRAIDALEVRQGRKVGDDDSREDAFRIKGGLEELERLLTSGPRESEDDRTIYAEPFDASVNHDDVRKMFAEYGDIVYISIPRFRDGKAKGFAFVEFDDMKSLQRCIRCVSLESGPMRVMSKKKWVEKKEQYKQLKKEMKKRAREESLKVAKALDQTTKKRPKRPSRPAGNLHENDASQTDIEVPPFVKGVVFSIKGLRSAKNVTRKALYECLEEYGPIAYLEYKKKSPDECTVRYMHPVSAQRALESLSGEKCKILGEGTSARILEGNEETIYWEFIVMKMKEVHQKRQARKARKASHPDIRKLKRANIGRKNSGVITNVRQENLVNEQLHEEKSDCQVLRNSSPVKKKNALARSHIVFEEKMATKNSTVVQPEDGTSQNESIPQSMQTT